MMAPGAMQGTAVLTKAAMSTNTGKALFLTATLNGEMNIAPKVQETVAIASKVAQEQVVTGAPIGIQGVNSADDYLALLNQMQHAEVTARMQAHVSAAAATVDARGVLAFTGPQQRAVARWPGLFDAYRGNRIDWMARDAIVKDTGIQNMLPGLRSFYTKGPDFYQPSTFRWWDMTTLRQWPAHQAKYGGNGTLLPTR